MPHIAVRTAVTAAVLILAGSFADAAEVKDRVLGDPDAPVTIIEYSSLTCPHCAAFHNEILPDLEERYIETGKAKLIMRDFPLDQYAMQASMIAHCAGDDRYFQFIEAMFANQERWARAGDPTAALLQLAQLGGLPKDEATACLEDQALGDAVLQARLDGQTEFDIRSTPTFIIEGEKLTGAQSVDEFAKLIDPHVD